MSSYSSYMRASWYSYYESAFVAITECRTFNGEHEWWLSPPVQQSQIPALGMLSETLTNVIDPFRISSAVLANSGLWVKSGTPTKPFGPCWKIHFFLLCCYFAHRPKIHTCTNRTNTHALMQREPSEPHSQEPVRGSVLCSMAPQQCPEGELEPLQWVQSVLAWNQPSSSSTDWALLPSCKSWKLQSCNVFKWSKPVQEERLNSTRHED